MSQRWTFVLLVGLVLVYWMMLIHGIVTGRLWRRHQPPILRSREPTFFAVAAAIQMLIGLLGVGGLVWWIVALGVP